MIQIKTRRVYDEPEASDGYRVLVDRLWPRGKKKEDVPYDLWDKEVAPSNELRKWFHENPDGHWDEFKRKYLEELKHSSALEGLKAKIKGQKVVTLLYGAKNETENQAVVLKELLHGL